MMDDMFRGAVVVFILLSGAVLFTTVAAAAVYHLGLSLGFWA